MPKDITKITCKRCGNVFRFSLIVLEDPEKRMPKKIGCPWCGEENGTITTGAEIISRKITDDQPSDNSLFGKIKWYDK